MAGINDIFSGQLTKVFYGTAGETDVSLITSELTNINTIGTLEDSASEITVSEYGGDGYTRKLVGRKTAGPLALTLNWVPEDAGHQAMKAAYDNGTKHSFAIEWVGTGGTTGQTAVFQGLVQSFSIETPSEDTATASVNILIDGGFTVAAKA